MLPQFPGGRKHERRPNSLDEAGVVAETTSLPGAPKAHKTANFG